MLAKTDFGMKHDQIGDGSPDSAQQPQQEPETAQASDAEAPLPNGHAPAAAKQGKLSDTQKNAITESYTHGLEFTCPAEDASSLMHLPLVQGKSVIAT